MSMFETAVGVGESQLGLLVGDLTQQSVDAIVNSANSSLLGGGGVDGAIHRAAGPELLAECRSLGGCPTGEAKITKGYDLPADWVIHTVGPIFSGSELDPIHLGNCIENSLKLFEEKALRSVLFSAISTGVYGYPKQNAAEIMLEKAYDYLKVRRSSFQVGFCLFSRSDFEVFEKCLKKIEKLK